MALEVPEEAIEKALLGAMGFDSVQDDDRTVNDAYLTEQMGAALTAAAPLIVAADLVRLADEVEGQPVELVDLMGAGKHYNAGKGYVAGLLRSRARELRGEPAVLPCGHLADYVENDEVTADEHERCPPVLRGEGDPK